MQPLTRIEPLLNAQHIHSIPTKHSNTGPLRAPSMAPAQVPAKRRQPPSLSTLVRPEASTSASGAAGAAATTAASNATSTSTSNRPLKKKTLSSNDDSIATRLQPKLSQSSWRRTKSYQHVDLSGPTRRTVLEWLPREMVFMILHLLSSAIYKASCVPTSVCVP